METNDKKPKNKILEKMEGKFIKWGIAALAVCLLAGVIIWLVTGNKGGKVTTITESSLEKMLEISELSTVQFNYSAIARALDDKENEKYYVSYKGTVTAGIDFEKITTTIDEASKTITLQLPEAEIQDTAVDFGSMEFIFNKNKYEKENISQEAYALCVDDLAERASQEIELLKLAKDNAVSAVEALIEPWVSQVDSEYTVNIQ